MTVLCGWEDNRKSGVAPAMRHRLCGIYIHRRTGSIVTEREMDNEQGVDAPLIFINPAAADIEQRF